MPIMRAFRPGAMIVLIRVWPVLKSLPERGTLVLLRQLLERRNIDGQVGRAVGEGNAAAQRGIGVKSWREK